MKSLLFFAVIVSSIALTPIFSQSEIVGSASHQSLSSIPLPSTNSLRAEELEEIIRDEMSRLDQIAGFRTDVKLTDADTSIAHPDNTISLSRPEIIKLQQRVQTKQFRHVLRFLLAHEKTHQIQYRWYSVSAVKANDAERRRLYEAQADILAGKYLIETFGEPTQDDLVTIIDTLKLAFDMGTLEFSNTDHPSKEARRTAARLGMASGMITSLSRLPPTPALGNMMASLAEKVDILRDESVMEWSYRAAKRITHYSRSASSDIVKKDSQIDWDKSASNPFVTFSLTYENTGQRTIHVDMEVQCASVPREDSDDTLEWLKWSVKNFRFDLKPGQQYIAKGRLQWYATEKLMPRLVYPPRATALMSAEYVK